MKKDRFLVDGEDWSTSMQSMLHQLMSLDIGMLIEMRESLQNRRNKTPSYIGIAEKEKPDPPISGYTAYLISAIITLIETGNPKLLEVLSRRNTKNDQDQKGLFALIEKINNDIGGKASE